MYTMNDLPSQSREPELSNETVEVLPLEPKAEGRELCSDVNTLFTFSLDESTSVVAEAKIDTESNTLNILLTNCNLVTVGRSDTQQLKCNCHLQEENKCVSNSDNEVRSDSASKTADSANRSLGGRKPTEYQLQHFNEAAEDCKPVDSDEIVGSVEPLLPLIKKQGYLNGSQCERIMEQLEILQDNGKFGEHEGLVTSYLCRCGEEKNSDLELALRIERGVAFSYHKEFKNSKRMFTSVIKSDKELRNPNILIARAYFLLVADYRSKKVIKLSPLFEFLRRSEFLLQNHDSPEDWAELYYNYGSVWLVYMSMIPDDERNAQARNTARGNARYYYEQAISFCKKDPRLRVQIKKQTYIHLKLAALLLDCSSKAARTRQKVIPPTDIKEAKEHLDFVQYKLGVCLPLGTRVQLLKTRSDQFYRQEIFQLAKETAEDALQIALSNEFYTEIDTLRERIDFLDKLCEEGIKVIAIKEISSSSSEICCSESAESE
ncbi:uncharacterized protein LOC144636316 [Oculina patagonica]